MFKNKSARIAAFIGTLGASAALIGAAATNTGAYFTDSETGQIAGTTGHLTVDKLNDYNLSFDNLVPGEYKDRSVAYRTGGDTNEDIWLKFPAGTPYGQFTGAKDNGSNGNIDGFADGGMGRFGHFAVKDNAGNVLFSSYNLQNESNGTSGCADSNGHGSGPQATSPTNTPPLCGVPHYMLIETNLPSGSDRSLTMTFGVTGKQTQQGQYAPPANVPFQVVATQHGVRPDALNF
jgi:hypothetical protein